MSPRSRRVLLWGVCVLATSPAIGIVAALTADVLHQLHLRSIA